MTIATDLSDLVQKLAGTRLLVVGDIMLDRFVAGDVERISPEAPIPVLKAVRHSQMLGGSGNVLSNLRGLGAHTTVLGVVGDDAEGRAVMALCQELGVQADQLQAIAGRKTSLKTRFLSQNQQLLRVDDETAEAVDGAHEQSLIAALRETVPQAQVVILSDYGKGVLTPAVIRAAIDLANARNIPVIVDPKGHDYSRYAGAFAVTPNRKELSEATGGMPTSSDADVVAAAQVLLEKSGIQAVVATRSQDGMTIVQKNAAPVHLRTNVLEVFDVSGAGDTVVAIIGAALAAGAPLVDAAKLGNIGGGIVVAKVGTAPIRSSELLTAISEQDAELNAYTGHGDPLADLYDWQKAREQILRWKSRGLKVGFTNGCFDILHAGHVNYLNQARSHCDRLVLGLNHDRSVQILKGPTRPVNDELSRATVIGGLAAIDMVVLFGATQAGADNTPCDLLKVLEPDIFFKGGDYTLDQLPEAKIVKAYGGEVRIMGLTEGLSTTKTIEKINSSKVA